ncbi:ELM1/GtrOC1 family putative glycosyltransferase [Desulfobotulus sp.]|jgi:mitochondrial fission protein ELM1|uniref:ELM1/GtrOC1 family putative glycosyltransferase n=1 Tax=Desulfobotulus sp. TaxID=1940337 RepID=UPI002A361AED|nr:ELM1/GtrOC1 family putative glycosyltransferase [Desulfobotulus sp.]MDY0162403.1 ELM1/GtrOC1 family putative glycosyltransferase [Desulfobotulus sp.]
MIPHPLRILCIGDGRPGHEKQTLAMAEAFGRLTLVETRWFRPPEGRVFAVFSRVQALGADCFPFFTSRILKSWGWGEKGFIPDLVMAAGSHTHGALLVFGKHYGARTLVCMTPDAWVRSRVDLTLSPTHDGRKPDARTLLTLGPPCRLVSGEGRKENYGLVLVGGLDPSSHVWDEKALEDALCALFNANPRMRWEVSSSPRTPESTEVMLERICKARPEILFIPFSRTPRGWVENAYARSSEAWITGDSMSMIYEALAAGCRVGVLPVRWKREDNKFQRSLDLLHGKGWIAYPGERPEKGAAVLDEAGRAAEEAVKRWWKKD